MLSYESRLLQLKRLERWCCKATRWQQFRVAVPLGLFLGIVAGLPAALASYPAPDEICGILTDEIKIRVGGSILWPDFSACPAASGNERARSEIRYGTDVSFKSAVNTKKHAPLHRTLTVRSLNPSPQICILLPAGNCVTAPIWAFSSLSDEQRGMALILRSRLHTTTGELPCPTIDGARSPIQRLFCSRSTPP